MLNLQGKDIIEHENVLKIFTKSHKILNKIQEQAQLGVPHSEIQVEIN